MKQRFKFILILVISFSILSLCNAEIFNFSYVKGEKYRILSVVHEDVIVNGVFNNHSEIINRISVEITDVKTSQENNLLNTIGTHKAYFMTTENAETTTSNQPFTWGEEYTSIFDRDKNGIYTIDDQYFMPVVRNLPIFPDRDLQPGDTWQYDGYEAHDLRRVFNIQTPFKIPFTASYLYEGTINANGKQLNVIKVNYNIFYEVPTTGVKTSNYPVSTMGYSHQTIYWDNERHTIDSYQEDFRIIIETRNGDRIEYKGNAGSEYTESNITTKQESINKVMDEINKLDIENAIVTSDDKGITLSIENIQFEPNSALLTQNEKTKLDKIATILQTFQTNDLLISGHTALAGSLSTCQTLSEERAKTVANYLIQLGVKDAYHIFTQGFGASIPIADNNTPEGMAHNRRVEITIMD